MEVNALDHLANADLQPFVSRLCLHSQLSEEEQSAILRLPSRARQAAANRDIVRLGETTDHACFVVDGLVARFGQNAEGARQITAFLIPGDVADLHSAVLPQATSALQALTTTTILQVPHADLHGVAKAYPGIAEAFWRECMIHAGILSQWVVNVGRRDALTRMAHLLCEMAVRYGAFNSYRFPATQTHLADATGMTPVHVNRTLRTLREHGLAAARPRLVQILDWDRLQRAGEFDSGYLTDHLKGGATMAARRAMLPAPTDCDAAHHLGGRARDVERVHG
jgi:CRP-like cAMP-binding protein